MKEYQSHKKVKAAQITAVNDSDPSGVAAPGVDVVLDDGDTAHLTHDMIVRHKPQIGDYLVEYDGGYRSISPKAAFEDGYTAIYAESSSI